VEGHQRVDPAERARYKELDGYYGLHADQAPALASRLQTLANVRLDEMERDFAYISKHLTHVCNLRLSCTEEDVPWIVSQLNKCQPELERFLDQYF
jgi:hypothetical protein